MRRDDDLMRLLMLDLEQASDFVTDRHKVTNFTRDQVAYHLAIILKSGMAEGPDVRYTSTGSDPTIPATVIVKRLTPAGHDFIANLRDEAVWIKVKERVAKIGGSVSLDLLGQIGGAVIKQVLGLA